MKRVHPLRWKRGVSAIFQLLLKCRNLTEGSGAKVDGEGVLRIEPEVLAEGGEQAVDDGGIVGGDPFL